MGKVSKKAFGERLRELRKEAGLSTLKLGEAVGVHNTAISNWELGRYLPSTSKVVDDLAKALNTDADRLNRAWTVARHSKRRLTKQDTPPFFVIGKELRRLRVAREWTGMQTALEIGIGSSTLQRCEAGIAQPLLRTIMRYAEVFGVDVESLLDLCRQRPYDGSPRGRRRSPHVATTPISLPEVGREGPRVAIGRGVRHLRELRGWTLDDMAARMSLSLPALRAIEANQRLVGPVMRKRLAKVFGVDRVKTDAEWSEVHATSRSPARAIAPNNATSLRLQWAIARNLTPDATAKLTAFIEAL